MRVPFYIPELGKHVMIDAGTFAETLPRDTNLRLMRMWIQARIPRAIFECEALTLGGE